MYLVVTAVHTEGQGSVQYKAATLGPRRHYSHNVVGMTGATSLLGDPVVYLS